MAALTYRELGIKRTGNKCTVPENPYGKLMYYLQCVDSVIQYNFNKKLTNYNQYYNLTNEEKLAIKTLCFLLNPKVLVDANVFIYKPELCIDFSNEFYEITDKSLGFLSHNKITIGGVEVKVRKIMAFKGNWIENNYANPFKQIIQIEEREKQQQYKQLPQQPSYNIYRDN